MLANIIGSMVRFESIKSSLQTRTFSTGQDSFRDFNLMGWVQWGEVSVVMDETHQVTESSIFCIPHKKSAKVVVPPGSQIWILGYSDDLTALVTGADHDSVKLDVLMRQFSITQCNKQSITEEFLPLLRLIEVEIATANKRSRNVICSLIRVLLICIYRLSNMDTKPIVRSPDELVLQQFRQLVEVEYRNRRTVSFYCEAMAMTYDRLHAICQRNLQKSPLQLINHRILMEATLRLKKSSDSIQVIANRLGFSNASQFSHFFKKEMGHSPSHFKRHYAVKTTEQNELSEAGFSDWP
ncbi:helix-turn-helix domain-containing protein [Rhodanobacter aciditrophus]|uniref:Helix-turn-helix domain-containing protein n=1 Tax=Rhodanobacter aciditrophus TaxID=1623218 RepID=A0ABW4B6H1_9GAMM